MSDEQQQQQDIEVVLTTRSNIIQVRQAVKLHTHPLGFGVRLTAFIDELQCYIFYSVFHVLAL